ncbi:LOW QUALITY PROTEIN: hypothetical protein V2J09_005675, partial [Rumex salicifolius]
RCLEHGGVWNRRLRSYCVDGVEEFTTVEPFIVYNNRGDSRGEIVLMDIYGNPLLTICRKINLVFLNATFPTTKTGGSVMPRTWWGSESKG